MAGIVAVGNCSDVGGRTLESGEAGYFGMLSNMNSH